MRSDGGGPQEESFTYRGASWHRRTQTASGTTSTFLYDGDNVVADFVGAVAETVYVTPFLDEHLSLTRSSATHYYTHDGLGSIRTVTDSSGSLVNRYAYTAFGEPYAPGTSVALAQRYTYTARELNPLSATLFYRHRTLAPTLGRFTSRDPLGYADGPNLYPYVDNRPLHLTDPFGLDAVACLPGWAKRVRRHVDPGYRAYEFGEYLVGLFRDLLNEPDRAKMRTQDPDAFTEKAIDRIQAGDRMQAASDKEFIKSCGKGGELAIHTTLEAEALVLTACIKAVELRPHTTATLPKAPASPTGSKSVRWNDGWRTPDGKFATPRGPGRPGAAAERAVWDAIKKKPGWSIIEKHVSVRDATGQLRVYDGVAVSPSGRNIGLEVKSGSGTLKATQRAFDCRLNASAKPGIGVGRHKGLQVRRALEIRVPR